MVFKKAYSLYHQTAALLVVLVILTASIFYVIISPAGPPPEAEVDHTDISYPCPEDPRCKDITGEIAAIQETEIQVTNCEISDAEIAITSNERQMFDLINNYRQQNGVSALSLSQGLSRAAAWLSHEMAERDVLNHTDSLGRSPSQRVGNCGYSAYKAENIAMNTRTDPTATFEGWRNSSGHNANMLGDAKFIGIAEWRVSGKSYWTTDFGVTSDGSWDGGTPAEPTNPPQQPTATVNPTLTPTTTPEDSNAVNINMEFTLPGIGNNILLGQNPVPARPASASVWIYDLNDEPVSAGLALFAANYTNDSGTFKATATASGITNGSYKIKILADSTLEKLVPGVYNLDPGQSINLPLVGLVSGDINIDNELSLIDYNILLSCYRTLNCEAGQKISSDLNIDGVVDEKDINIFYSGLAKRTGD